MDDDDELDKVIREKLYSICYPDHITGHTYTSEAVKMLIKEPYAFSSMTKDVYPAIARKYNVNTASVERAIRSGISYMEAHNQIFSYYTNGTLIKSLAEAIGTQMKENQKGDMITMTPEQQAKRSATYAARRESTEEKRRDYTQAISICRRIRDDPNSTDRDKLDAIKLLAKLTA